MLLLVNQLLQLYHCQKSYSMELIFAYFWIIKLVFATIGIFSAYKAFNFKSLFKGEKYTYKLNKVWFGIFLIISLIGFFNPIRMDISTTKQQSQSNYIIEQTKIVPEIVEDNSFKIKAATDMSISKEDLK